VEAGSGNGIKFSQRLCVDSVYTIQSTKIISLPSLFTLHLYQSSLFKLSTGNTYIRYPS